jgi:hypothetical protein
MLLYNPDNGVTRNFNAASLDVSAASTYSARPRSGAD